jgi:hypothetical protein
LGRLLTKRAEISAEQGVNLVTDAERDMGWIPPLCPLSFLNSEGFVIAASPPQAPSHGVQPDAATNSMNVKSKYFNVYQHWAKKNVTSSSIYC